MLMIFLKTERLILRSHETGDEGRFVAMQTDPLVRRFVGGSPWSEERALSRFRSEYLGQPVNPDGLWATVLKSENAYIGHCGICAREEPTEMRLAYYIAQPYWGRGYATEASRAFVAVAFEKLGLKRIVAEFQDGNTASVRVLNKLGFSLHHKEELRGRIFQSYELTRQIWSQSRLINSSEPTSGAAH